MISAQFFENWEQNALENLRLHDIRDVDNSANCLFSDLVPWVILEWGDFVD